ncbi:MAG TPA: MFS transporter [Oceanipulchritudo sp.]|nr:MFS transporter [Oceanipulchritudo sp.]
MNNRHDKILFWGCFIALITTSYAFFSRMYLCGGRFMLDFNLDKVAAGELAGAGIWPFGVSIILFSLFIDKVGYKVAMIFSFVCYLVYTGLAIMAYGAIQGLEGEALLAAQSKGHTLLYVGSIILGLGNGAVEAYINPLVATMFKDAKTKWLNILHAGWPLGLVLGGLVTISLSGQAATGDWRLIIALILVPALTFFIVSMPLTFPRSEREQAGVGYIDMLKEMGGFGALVGFGLVFGQLGQVWGWPHTVAWVLTGIVVVAFVVLTKSVGRGIFAMLIIIMMPLATTELGTDGWISSLMEQPMSAAGFNPGWVLVYTSAIMVILRFSAGPIVHKLSPLGLLASCALLASVGLTLLSRTGDAGVLAIFAAATFYGVGKTFFWPTMLGVASEQCPRGGAMTLNTLGGIGMLAVGILGAPFIGFLQESTATNHLKEQDAAVYQQVHVEKEYLLGKYDAIDPLKATLIMDEQGKTALASANKAGQFGALAKMALFPLFMFACYVGLILHFRSKGGYKPVQI